MLRLAGLHVCLIRLPTTPMSLRSTIHALVFILAGVTLFIFGCLCAIEFLVDRDCGHAWGYYGCNGAPTIDPAGLPRIAPSEAISAHALRAAVLDQHPKISVRVGVQGPKRAP